MEIISRALGMLLITISIITTTAAFSVVGTTLRLFLAVVLPLSSFLHEPPRLLLRSYSAAHFQGPLTFSAARRSNAVLPRRELVRCSTSKQQQPTRAVPYGSAG